MAAKILLIDDNPENKKLAVYLLEHAKHEVHTTDTGEEGIRVAMNASFDLIVCDIHLPGVDGYEVATRLKASPHWKKVPMIAVTALAMVGDRERVLLAGFDGYISKPIVPRTFTQQIESFLSTTSFVGPSNKSEEERKVGASYT